MPKIYYFVAFSLLVTSCSSLKQTLRPDQNQIEFQPLIGSLLVNTQHEVIQSNNTHFLFTPASLLKLYHLPVFYSLQHDTTFLTTTFSLVEHEEKNELIISSYGDPLLSWTEIDSVSKLIQKPISILRITTQNYDTTEFWGPGWMYDDEPSNFQSFLSAFPIDENTVSIRYSRHNGIDSIQQSNPNLPIIFNNNPIKIERDQRNQIVISRPDSIQNIPLIHKIFSYRNPQIINEIALKSIFKNDSVCYVQNDRQTIIQQWKITHSFNQLMTKIYSQSDNFAAEQTLRYIGLQNVKVGTIKNGLNFEKKQKPNNSLKVVDASGLSRYNLISISSLKEVMDTLQGNLDYKKWFAVYGKTGTLDDRLLLGNHIKIYAKSGSMTGIQNIAGFIYQNDRYLGYFILMKNNTNELKEKRYQVEQETLLKLTELLGGKVK